MYWTIQYQKKVFPPLDEQYYFPQVLQLPRTSSEDLPIDTEGATCVEKETLVDSFVKSCAAANVTLVKSRDTKSIYIFCFYIMIKYHGIRLLQQIFLGSSSDQLQCCYE